MLAQRRTFFNLFKFGSTRLVYPPKPSAFTTGNRIFENYVSRASELHDYLLFKQPTILNLTTCDAKCNQHTQYLYDILSDAKKYPNNVDVNMVNVLIDYTQDSNEILQKFSVNGPCLLLLRNQLVRSKLVANTNEEIYEWVGKIKH